MIASNSCGVRSIMAQFYGPGPRTSDNVHELEVLLYDGRRLRAREGTSGDPEIDRRLTELRDRYGDLIRERYPKIPRRVSGYNLDDLLPENGFHVARALAGTESTCVTYLEATVHLLHSPPHRSLLVLGYEDAPTAGDAVPTVLEHRPLGLEGMDETLIQDMTQLGKHVHDLSRLPDGHGWLLVEFGGEDKVEADEHAHKLMSELKVGKDGLRGMKLYDVPEQEEHVWKVREAGLGATAFLPGKHDTYEGWEDSAVPPERIGDYLRDLQKLASKFGYESSLYGHYGNGCVHARWNFDLSSRPGLAKYRAFVEEGADLVVSYGGSISGEHGDGQSRGELLPKMFGPELIEAFREFKSIWDPDWKMNPGKVVDPYPLDSSIRLGPETFNPPPVDSHFSFLKDRGSFAHATTRCVGVGKCRHTDGGVMCPSFMVTREEMHSTRGRAHLLWEMLNGEELRMWHDGGGGRGARPLPLLQGLHERLPGQRRHAGAEGRVPLAPLQAAAAAAPGLRVRTDRPGGAGGLEGAGGCQRDHEDAVLQGRGRDPPAAPGARVRAADAQAVVRATAAAQRRRQARDPLGGHVHELPRARSRHRGGRGARGRGLPRRRPARPPLLRAAALRLRHARSGRGLPAQGALGAARRDPRGTPVVGVEPSCVAVFRDELLKLWPMDQDAKRLAGQTHHFADFLVSFADGWEPPQLHRKALLHGHCHQQATGGTGPDAKLLERMGLEVEELDAGCCGMAGGWGYEEGHYDVSVACAERVLLPKVREAPPEAVIVADGFSCRSQIEQAQTGRRAVHVAQVLALAREFGPEGPAEPYPERAAPPRPGPTRAQTATRAAVAAAVGASAAAALAARASGGK